MKAVSSCKHSVLADMRHVAVVVAVVNVVVVVGME